MKKELIAIIVVIVVFQPWLWTRERNSISLLGKFVAQRIMGNCRRDTRLLIKFKSLASNSDRTNTFLMLGNNSRFDIGHDAFVLESYDEKAVSSVASFPWVEFIGNLPTAC
jgi:hypothetical protein